jgi:hypothetical protein
MDDGVDTTRKDNVSSRNGEHILNEESTAALSGNEPFLVGLSPSFWAHTPMAIRSLTGDGGGGAVRPRTPNGAVLLYHDRYPVSKCKLVGWIVSADHKGECHYYVVDDGTGLMVVLHYTEDEEVLPTLLLSDAAVHPNHYSIGDVVSIFGKIMYVGGKVEIRASTILEATPMDEMRHWQECCHAAQRLSNPLDIIAQLGTSIGDQIRDLANLPATDDSIGLWRLFGTSCRCAAGAIKDDLLYCKCIATVDSLDPNLSFRWALLERLLVLQERQPSNAPLQFPYHTVAENATLSTGRDTAATAVTTSRMVRNAFRILRQEGILYLYDKDNDTYVLISRSRVLEPFVRKTLTKFASQRPAFLEHVPSARLQIVRRSVLKSDENETT